MQVENYDNAVCTYSGLTFRFDEPHPDQVSIIDIGKALSQICRFTGHAAEFYSVAEHSCLVDDIVNWLCGGEAPLKLRRCAFLHDAPEAYTNDVSTPLKRMLPDYRAVEHRVWAEAVAPKFGLDQELPKLVKLADKLAYFIERNQLMHKNAATIDRITGFNLLEPAPELCVIPLSPKRAYTLFMKRARELELT